jgi:hypothetical protein
VLEHWAAARQYHVAAGALRQAVADLVVDHFVLIGLRPFELGRGQFDHLDGHIGAEAQAGVGDIVLAALLATFAAVIGDLFGGFRLGRWWGIAQQGAQVERVRVVDEPFLGFAPEQLAFYSQGCDVCRFCRSKNR